MNRIKLLIKTFFSEPVEPIPPSYNLAAVKKELWEVLNIAPEEAKAVRQAVIAGDIDGGYYIGECCCIKGIIAAKLGIPVKNLEAAYGIGLNERSYLENFLFNIVEGDAPESSAFSRALLEWCDEFIAEQKALKLRRAVEADLEEVLAAAMPRLEKEQTPEKEITSF
jgi:hypothetical protein